MSAYDAYLPEDRRKFIDSNWHMAQVLMEMGALYDAGELALDTMSASFKIDPVPTRCTVLVENPNGMEGTIVVQGELSVFEYGNVGEPTLILKMKATGRAVYRQPLADLAGEFGEVQVALEFQDAARARQKEVLRQEALRLLGAADDDDNLIADATERAAEEGVA